MLHHEDFDWAGTCDDPIQFPNGANMISDIKTGTQVETHLLQGVAYAMIWDVLFPSHPISSVGVLYIKHDYTLKPTYKFEVLELSSKKGQKLVAEWEQMMELFRIKYALKDGTYPIKEWYKPKEKLKLNNVDHNFVIKQ